MRPTENIHATKPLWPVPKSIWVSLYPLPTIRITRLAMNNQYQPHPQRHIQPEKKCGHLPLHTLSPSECPTYERIPITECNPTHKNQ